jgi:Methyltransferase small domain
LTGVRGLASTPPAWSNASQETLDRLRESFAQADFNEERLADQGLAPPLGGADDVWPLRAMAPDGALSVLVRLWMIGAAVEAAAASLAMAPAKIDELVAAGLLVRAEGDRVRATVSIKPYRELLIAGDRGLAEPDEPADFVPGVNPVARILAAHTIRKPVQATLDLATGNGMQGLAAARHSSEVLGTDVNGRALAYAGLNARLNGISNFRVAQGSWFEPVPDGELDLILANLPFVVSPDSASMYRDSGLPAGELGPFVLQEAARRLRAGGFAQVMCEWGVREGDDWAHPVQDWTAGTNCDVVVLRHQQVDPIGHAVAWNHRLAGVDPDAFESSVERWSAHHVEQRYAALAAATITLRRRGGGDPWFAALELKHKSKEGGAHLQAVFAGEDFVRALPDEAEALLRARLALADGTRLVQVLTRKEERWRQRPATLRLSPGLGLEGRVPADALDLVFALDGRPVDEVVEQVATRRDRDPQALRELARSALPDLVRQGFVRPLG